MVSLRSTPGTFGEPTCSAYDPSVEGRLKLFLGSVDRLLTPPANRPKKVTLTTADIHIEMGPKLWKDGSGKPMGLTLTIPKGMPVGVISSFRHKNFLPRSRCCERVTSHRIRVLYKSI